MDVDRPLGLIRLVVNMSVVPDRNEETGQYTGEYSTEDFLSAISAEDGLAGTGEIADKVGCAHDTAYKRLLKMEEDGLVTSQKLGNTLLWTTQSESEES